MRTDPSSIWQVLELGFAAKRIVGLRLALWRAEMKARARSAAHAAVLAVIAGAFSLGALGLGLAAAVVLLVDYGLTPAAALASVAAGALVLALALAAMARSSLNKALNS